MWQKSYKDYPNDSPLKKETVESGKGIIGCEMHDVNGWGISHHVPKKRKKGFFSSMLSLIFRENRQGNDAKR